MTAKEDDKAAPNGEGQLESGATPATSPVSTHVGRNNVSIDVPALKHLVDTVKAKLKP
jgi:hypothetical protein